MITSEPRMTTFRGEIMENQPKSAVAVMRGSIGTRALFGLVLVVGLATNITGCGALVTQDDTLGRASSALVFPSQAPRSRGDSVSAVRHLARAVAIALADDDFRIRLFAALHSSRAPEGKLEFQRFLSRRGRPLARRIEQLNHVTDGSLELAMRLVPDLELYLPVPDHRAGWRGGNDILVTGFIESEAELRKGSGMIPGYAVDGTEHPISYFAPGTRPVLVLTGVESQFDETGESAAVPAGAMPQPAAPCTGKKCPPPPPPPPADPCASSFTGTTLLLCRSTIVKVSDYEGALRGSPEISMKLFSVLPNGTGMVQIGCVNEDQPGDQFFDQDGDSWAGRARIGTKAAIDQARAAGRSVLMQVWEDDNGSKCDFYTRSDAVRNGLHLLGQVGAGISIGWLLCSSGCDNTTPPWPLFLVGVTIGAITDYLLGNDDDQIGYVALPAGSDPFNGSVPILRVERAGEAPIRAGTLKFAIQS